MAIKLPLLSASAIGLCAACAHAPPQGLQIGLPPEVDHASKSVLATRLAYGLGRAAAWNATRGKTHNDSGDDFVIELAGWTLALSVRKDPQLAEHDPDLDLVAEVNAAGFLSEFVILVYGRPGWTVPPKAIESLKVTAFLAWAHEHLEGHHLGPVASTTPTNGKRWPDVPGADLPELKSCASHDVFDEALARWQAAEPQLDGVPVSAKSGQDFLEQLAERRTQGGVQSKSVTWVSPQVSALYSAAGFCANDRQNFPLAVTLLERAVAIAPSEFNPRLELAHAFAALKRPDQAVPHLEVALRIAHNPCHFARAWRKMGFVRFDQGRFQDAKQAYQNSLAYEPNNALALNELELIDQALARGGDQSPGTAAQYPQLPQITTQCSEPAPPSGGNPRI